MASVEKIIARTFMQMAEGLETGSFGPKPKIGLTGLGSEVGEDVVLAGAVLAAERGADVYYIGTLEDYRVTTIKVSDEDEAHKTMDKMLEDGEIDGAVTMHYPFPIGVSTVGRIITPALGKEMFIANTTGTSSGERIEGMILNTIAGIITAKACGIARPTVGILNVDGARQCEMALNQLKENGYDFDWAVSSRHDGGVVMRGNDMLKGSPDVMVMDSLTGNVMMKIFSSFTTGGSFESTGFAYGPGIGKGYDKLVMIVSRASGTPVIANAIQYAVQLVNNDFRKIAAAEYAAAEKAGLNDILAARKAASKPAAEEDVTCPAKEPVTASIPGIEVMDLEDAAKCLWKAGIYAETGMGCTGPLVMMSEANFEKAEELLKAAGYIG